MKKIFLLAALAWGSLQAQVNPTLLKDIRPGQDGCEAVYDATVAHNGYVYFVAEVAAGNYRLIKTDGTTNGTTEVAGDNSNFIYGIIGRVNDKLVVVNFVVSTGMQLFTYDTGTGSFDLLADPDPSPSALDILVGGKVDMNGYLLFSAASSAEGYELWRTDATPAGTYLVKDINPGVNSSGIGPMYNWNGVAYFDGGTDAEGAELWRSDGTANGTYLVKDIYPDNTFNTFLLGSHPASFCAYNNKLYFNAENQVNGRELWVTDGTTNGTSLVEDLAAGSSVPSYLQVLNNALFFVAYDDNNGYSLWKSDGTAPGTSILKDIALGEPDDVDQLFLYNNKLYFRAYTANTGIEIFSSDGTANGTSLAVDVLGGSDGGYPGDFLVHNNQFYFYGYDANFDYQVFRSNGTQGGTFRLSSYAGGVNGDFILVGVNSCVMFEHEAENQGLEPHVSCGNVGVPLANKEVELEVFDVFPNPVNEVVSFQFTTQLSGTLSWEILDVQGRQVYAAAPVEIGNGSHTVTFGKAGELTPGIYIIRCTTSEGTGIRKFVKN